MTSVPENARFAYIHPECGGPAFYLAKLVHINDVFIGRDIITLAGEPPKLNTPITCGTCKKGLNFVSVDNVRSINRFDMTGEGCKEAKEYLDNVGELDNFNNNKTSVDGYSLIAWANAHWLAN